jgi:hypothetical protein
MIGVTNKISDQSINNHYNTYFKLNVNLEVEQDAFVVDLIKKYAHNTSSSNHGFKLKIKNILKVTRPNEVDNIDMFKQFGNRQLLWHGSRIANIMGILSSGLQINPSNVVRTGSMFGNGVYFSNTASKSAQYVHSKTDGVILLCEVALGTCYELTHAQYVTTLPSGFQSTHGVGKTCPDPSQYYTDQNGLIFPMGPLQHSGKVKNSSLLFDEFIVYDPRQIRIKYVLTIDL